MGFVQRDESYFSPARKQKDYFLFSPRVSDILDRIFKIGGYALGAAGLLFAGAAMPFLIAPTLAGIAGAGLTVGAIALTTGSAKNVYFREEKDLMFRSHKDRKGKIHIYQKFGFRKGMKDFDKFDIAGFMALNTVVGLSRFQDEFKKDLDKQEFTVKTHNLNVKILEELEKAGYLNITNREEKGKSNLFFEKLGVRNFKSAGRAFLNKDGKEKMQQIDFKLTDKKIDLEKMYIDYSKKSDKEKNSSKLGKLLFSDRYGFLSKDRFKGISHSYDKYGRLIIDYKAKEPGMDKIKKDIDVMRYNYDREKDSFVRNMQEKTKNYNKDRRFFNRRNKNKDKDYHRDNIDNDRQL